MKNVLLALLFILGFAGFSFAGNCENGVCSAPARPVRKAVEITRNIVVAPVYGALNLASRCCDRVTQNVCCENQTREVRKYQPLRRRLVHRTTTVSCGCQ